MRTSDGGRWWRADHTPATYVGAAVVVASLLLLGVVRYCE
jgi:hypothetical protein